MTLRTLLGKSSRDIQRQLRLLVQNHSRKPSVCLFTFSGHEGVDWGSCWSEILQLEDAGHRTLGCISSPLPNRGHERHSGVSCSIGIFDSSQAVPFRSTILGNEAISVGKWHCFKKPETNASDEFLDGGAFPDGKVSWDDIWQQGRTQEIEMLEDLKSVRYKPPLRFIQKHADIGLETKISPRSSTSQTRPIKVSHEVSFTITQQPPKWASLPPPPSPSTSGHLL
jgi:hypothetical protein